MPLTPPTWTPPTITMPAGACSACGVVGCNSTYCGAACHHARAMRHGDPTGPWGSARVGEAYREHLRRVARFELDELAFVEGLRLLEATPAMPARAKALLVHELARMAGVAIAA